MDASLVIALIALAGSVFSTLATLFWDPRLRARREARARLETYREPLLVAAYELQARLHNIVVHDFLQAYAIADDEERRMTAIASTLYVFGQFFAWREIIRHEVQLLRFRRDDETREVEQLLRKVGDVFLSDGYGQQLMIWRVEQRGLGELMMVRHDGRPSCIGFATFVKNRGELSEFDSIERDLLDLDREGRERLVKAQHLLLDLVNKLDPSHIRYPDPLARAATP